MTRTYYIPNQQNAPRDKAPGKFTLANRAAKLADRQRIANDCRFIRAEDWAKGVRFPERRKKP